MGGVVFPRSPHRSPKIAARSLAINGALYLGHKRGKDASLSAYLYTPLYRIANSLGNRISLAAIRARKECRLEWRWVGHNFP